MFTYSSGIDVAMTFACKFERSVLLKTLSHKGTLNILVIQTKFSILIILITSMCKGYLKLKISIDVLHIHFKRYIELQNASGGQYGG